MFRSTKAKVISLVVSGLLVLAVFGLGLVYLFWYDIFWFDSIGAGQIDYESVSVYAGRPAEAGYVIVDDPACNRETDFSQVQPFRLTQDSVWIASLPLSADDQDRYYCLRLSAGWRGWRGVDYISVGPIDTTPPALVVQASETDLILQMEWLSAAEMGLRRPNHQIVVQAARLQPDSDCDESARDSLNNRLPVRSLPLSPTEAEVEGASLSWAPPPPMSHPDNLDLSRHLLIEPGSASGYDSSTHLTLAAIPLADLSPESDYCFYVYDSRLSSRSGSYIVYPRAD